MNRKCAALASLPLWAIALAAGPSGVGHPFATGFETPGYSVGQPVNGADGWFGVEFVPGEAAGFDSLLVTQADHAAASGRRAATCNMADLPALFVSGGVPSEHLRIGDWVRLMDFSRVPESHNLIRVEWDASLTGPSTNTNSGPWLDDLVGVNIGIGNNTDAFAYISLSSSEFAFPNAFSSAGNFVYQLDAPAAISGYHHFAMVIDRRANTITFQCDAATIGSHPFVASASDTWYVLIEAGCVDEPELTPRDYQAFWDNISVQTSASH